MSLAEFSYGTANGFLISQLYANTMSCIYHLNSLQSLLNSRQMSRSPPSNKIIFSWRVWFSLILECKLGKPLYSLLQVSLWPVVPAYIALGTEQMQQRTQVLGSCPILQPRRALAPAVEHGAGEGSEAHKTGKQDARACQQEESSLRTQIAAFPYRSVKALTFLVQISSSAV